MDEASKSQLNRINLDAGRSVFFNCWTIIRLEFLQVYMFTAVFANDIICITEAPKYASTSDLKLCIDTKLYLLALTNAPTHNSLFFMQVLPKYFIHAEHIDLVNTKDGT